jgi:lantibiotic biosynthesis protein
MVTPIFVPAGFFLLRAPTLDLGTFKALTASTDVAVSTGVLLDAARTVRTRRAVRAASQSLSDELTRALTVPDQSGEVSLPARAGSSLLRYLTRMTTRPTPYGLFAGVAAGSFGEGTDLRLGDDPVRATRTRADLGWLLELIRTLESSPFAEGLATMVNPLLYRVGERAALPTADVHGRSDDRRVAFRLTEPARLALALAGDCPPRGVLAGQLQSALPEAQPEQIAGLLRQLADLNVLVTSLRPNLSTALPETDLVEQLAEVPGSEGVRESLGRVRELANAVDAANCDSDSNGTDPLGPFDQMVSAQSALIADYPGELFQTDTRLELSGRRLDRQVAATAAEAADLLHQLGCFKRRQPNLAEYHHAFVERYGLHTEVGVVEVLSPELGLDVPNGYSAAPRPFPLPPLEVDDGLQHRDAALASMTTEMLRLGEPTLELTDERVERLTVWRPGEGPALRPSVDLFCQIAATSAAALDNGDWSMVVSAGACADGGRTLGRFFDLLDRDDADRLAAFAVEEEALTPDLLYAELSYVPSHGRSANVTVHPPLRRHEICVNTAPSVPEDRRIPLSEILVGALSDRFYLRWSRTGQELRVTQSHLLLTMAAPNVCRFLLEASDDGFTPLPGFDWGVLGRSPFLPRVTRGRLVLHPAQWMLSPMVLGLDSQRPPDDRAFAAAVSRWRERWQVPRHVFLSVMDNRFLLDLDHPLYLAELSSELRRAFSTRQPLVLQEMLPNFEGTWLGAGDDPGTAEPARRHVFEIVVPMRAAEPALTNRPAPPTPQAAGQPAEPLQRRFLPGSEWLHLKLYAAPWQHEALVAQHLPDLTDRLRRAELLRDWFFIRYADPHPHLRIRVRATSLDTVPEVTRAVLDWAASCVETGLASDFVQIGYQREIERYGGPHVFESVERTFETSSELIAELLHARAERRLTLPADVTGVWLIHWLHRSWGLDPIRDLPDLSAVTISDASRQRFREIRAMLCGLLKPWPAHPDPTAEAARPLLEAAGARHRTAAEFAAARCRTAADAGLLHGSLKDIVASVAHMELNRLMNVSDPADQPIYELWFLAVAALRRRPDAMADTAVTSLTQAGAHV